MVHRFSSQPTDRPFGSSRKKILTQLFGSCCHPPTTKNQPPLSLSLSHSIAKAIPSSTKNLHSPKRRKRSKPQPTQECLYSLLHGHSSRRKTRSPCGTGGLLPGIQRQATVGAIYERFVRAPAAVTHEKKRQIILPKIHSTEGPLIPDGKADACYADQLQPIAARALSLSLSLSGSPALGRPRGMHYREESTASRARMDEPCTAPTPTVDVRALLIHSTSRPPHEPFRRRKHGQRARRNSHPCTWG